MTREDIAAVMGKMPDLHDGGIRHHGFCWTRNNWPSVQEINDRIAKEKQELLEGEEVCTLVCKWLKHVHFTKTANQYVSPCDYTLKHYAEDDIGRYVSTGRFIAAAIHCQVKYVIGTGRMEDNVFFAISRKCLERDRRARKRVFQPEYIAWEPFVDAILQDPESLTPRLVFADWLEEQGQDEKANV